MYNIAVLMNIRDNFVMWRPHTEAKPLPKNGESESSCSSSTSSSSSSVTSDDKRSIAMIREGMPDFRESNHNRIDFTKSYD